MAPTETIEYKVRTRLIELLFRNAPLSYTVTLINAVLVMLVLDDYVPGIELLIWLITIILITLLRLVLVSAYWNAKHPYDQITFYKNMHLVGVYATAVLWGVLIYIPGQHSEFWIESFIAVVIAGMTTGAVLALSPLLSAVLPYLLLILLPVAGFFFLSGDFRHFAMGLMVTFYLLLLTQLVFRNHKMLAETIRQEIEAKTMFQFLEKAKLETDRHEDLLEEQITNLPGNTQEKAVYFNTLDTPVVITAENGTIRQINQSVLHATGRDAEDMIGKNFSTLLVEADQDNIAAVLANIKSADTTLAPVRFRFARPGAETPIFNWKISRYQNLIFWTGMQPKD